MLRAEPLPVLNLVASAIGREPVSVRAITHVLADKGLWPRKLPRGPSGGARPAALTVEHLADVTLAVALAQGGTEHRDLAHRVRLYNRFPCCRHVVEPDGQPPAVRDPVELRGRLFGDFLAPMVGSGLPAAVSVQASAPLAEIAVKVDGGRERYLFWPDLNDPDQARLCEQMAEGLAEEGVRWTREVQIPPGFIVALHGLLREVPDHPEATRGQGAHLTELGEEAPPP